MEANSEISKPDREPDFSWNEGRALFWFEEMIFADQYYSENNTIARMEVYNDELAEVDLSVKDKNCLIFINQIQRAWQDWLIEKELLGEET